MPFRVLLFPALLLGALVAASLAGGSETGTAAAGPIPLPGPIPATLVRVVDGDTLRVEARIWPGHSVETLVRLEGIDAPELRARCPAEQTLARAAKARLAALVEGRALALHAVRLEKYAGRVAASVHADGGDLATQLLSEGVVRRYDGRTRAPWCDTHAPSDLRPPDLRPSGSGPSDP